MRKKRQEQERQEREHQERELNARNKMPISKIPRGRNALLAFNGNNLQALLHVI